MTMNEFTLFPCPPLLLLGLLLDRAWALSLKLSRALKLLETAILALLSLAESTLELPSKRPHLLPALSFDPVDSWPVDGDGEADGDGTDVMTRESSVNVSFAGSYEMIKKSEKCI